MRSGAGAIEFCLTANGADIQLVVRLRAGALLVEGTADGKRIEIYREDVEPLRQIKEVSETKH
jgi:hypothetical protein